MPYHYPPPPHPLLPNRSFYVLYVPTLIAPYAKRGQPFVLGFSDGSLIEGLRDVSSGYFLLQTLVEGAGIVTMDGDSLTLDWRVEWAPLAPATGAMMAEQRAGPMLFSTPINHDLHVGSVAEWLRRCSPSDSPQELADAE